MFQSFKLLYKILISLFLFNIHTIFIKPNGQVLNGIREKKRYIVTSYTISHIIQSGSIMVF